jgi:hypothetical protein
MSKESEKSLKTLNTPKVITFVVVNLAIIGIALYGFEQISSVLREGLKGELAPLVRVLGLPAVGSLAVGLLSWLIPRNWKEILVFWRLGARRLPSSEAFTSIAPADLRINMKQLSNQLGPLPTENAEQNTLWYSVYRKHCKEAAVNDANGAYLLYRDMSAIVPLILMAAIVLGAVLGVSFTRTAALLAGICVEFILLMVACRNAGRRLVANVLAIEASSAQPTGKKLITP